MTSKTDIYGLIGTKLSHSFSKEYFTAKFDREKIGNSIYNLFELNDIREFPNLISSTKNIKGLNVTIPYKESVIPYLDELEPVAGEIGAVNCISFHKGRLRGHNTDVFGFETSLLPLLPKMPVSALVLGTGGASKAVVYVLEKKGIDCLYVSRNQKNGAIAYSEVDETIIENNLLIINTTPLGMYPDINNCPPLPYHLLTRNHLLFDLVYNPETSVFLQNGIAKGAAIKNGMEMLYLQAEKSWEIWSSR